METIAKQAGGFMTPLPAPETRRYCKTCDVEIAPFKELCGYCDRKQRRSA